MRDSTPASATYELESLGERPLPAPAFVAAHRTIEMVRCTLTLHADGRYVERRTGRLVDHERPGAPPSRVEEVRVTETGRWSRFEQYDGSWIQLEFEFMDPPTKGEVTYFGGPPRFRFEDDEQTLRGTVILMTGVYRRVSPAPTGTAADGDAP